MKTIVKKTLIACDIEKLFDFHTDSANILKITPPNISVKVLNDDTSTYEGKIVKIKTIKNFIPIKWEVKIEKLEYPNILVDLAIKSPFKYWKHQHIFTKHADKCELKDIIEYELPYKPFSNIFDKFIEKDILDMFEYRHKKTKEFLETL